MIKHQQPGVPAARSTSSSSSGLVYGKIEWSKVGCGRIGWSRASRKESEQGKVG